MYLQPTFSSFTPKQFYYPSFHNSLKSVCIFTPNQFSHKHPLFKIPLSNITAIPTVQILNPQNPEQNEMFTVLRHYVLRWFVMQQWITETLRESCPHLFHQNRCQWVFFTTNEELSAWNYYLSVYGGRKALKGRKLLKKKIFHKLPPK